MKNKPIEGNPHRPLSGSLSSTVSSAGSPCADAFTTLIWLPREDAGVCHASASVVLWIKDVTAVQQHTATNFTARQTQGMGPARLGWWSSPEAIMEGTS